MRARAAACAARAAATPAAPAAPRCARRALAARASRAASSPATGGDASPAPALLERVCQALLAGYVDSHPTAANVLHALHSKHGGAIQIDHLAFRSFGIDGLGIDAAARFWLDLGYQRRDELTFPVKKLRATWLAPPEPPPGQDAQLPRVFVSEVDVAALSKRAQEIIRRATARAAPLGRHAALAAAVHEAPWPPPTLADYKQLAKESEYAAWVLVHGFTLNHATVAVHRLSAPPAPAVTLEDVNAAAEAAGATLNAEGGVLKTSADGGLRQSSTLADPVSLVFAGGEEVQVPGSYLEFAERLPLPEFAALPREQLRERHRRDGFEVASADKIFTSTAATQQADKS